MKRFVFEMGHYDETTDTDTLNYFGFEFLHVPPNRQEWFDGIRDGSTEEFDDFVSEMEESFGIHDFVAGGEEYVGYTSGEIKPENYLVVMELWHKWFTDHGITLGPIVSMGSNYDGSQDRI